MFSELSPTRKQNTAILIWCDLNLVRFSVVVVVFINNAHFASSRSVGLPRTASGRFSVQYKTRT